MSDGSRTPGFVWAGVFYRILCVGLLVIVLNLTPQARTLTEGLQDAQRALDDQLPRAALRRLDWILAHEPWRGPDLWRLVGTTALAAGDAQTARDILVLLDQNYQAEPTDWLALGDALWQLGDQPQAVMYWQRAADLGSVGSDSLSPAYLAARRVVDYHRTRKEFSGEITALRQLLRMRPTQEDFFRLGLLLMIRTPQEAVEALQSAVDLAPGGQKTPLTEAAARLEAGSRAALLLEEPAYVLLQCGRLLGTEGYWDLAYEAFRQVAASRPDLAEGWAYLAEASQQIRQQGGMSSADSSLERRWLEQAYQLNPESLLVNALSGFYWLRQDGAEQAIPFFEKASEIDPSNPLWIQSRGAALAAMDDLYAAQAAYLRAVEMAPGDPDSWRVLAEFHLHYEIQIAEVGLPAAEKAVVLDPDNPANQDAAGLARLLLGDWSEAEAYFQAALALKPEYAPALLHLGGLYLDRGQTEKAEEYLYRLINLVGDTPSAFLSSADVRRLQAWLEQRTQPAGEP